MGLQDHLIRPLRRNRAVFDGLLSSKSVGIIVVRELPSSGQETVGQRLAVVG
ncbi:protein of unknown function [Methylocaldum szegediense]|uniref:Uncharacterized protein n=1 Tax=Methylocaldum szegediense TaxID=73780 RepID=A0ABM9HXG2_9GAMM|nr:protein of unknown function [Methylocaldum szegediense]